MPNTLFGRLLVVSVLILLFFFSFIEYTTEQVYTRNLIQALKNQLELESYVLVSETEIDNNAIQMPEELHEKRFDSYESGLYGYITDSNGHILWRSYSSHSISLPQSTLSSQTLSAGQSQFKEQDDFYAFQRAVMWEVTDESPELIIFSLLESKHLIQEKTTHFKQQMRQWLAATGIALIVVFSLLFRWGTIPLRQLAKNLKLIEQGKMTRLEGRYPIELRRLSKNINGLIDAERKQRERYHATLSDLAHSLKTPLAVIQTEIELHLQHHDSYALIHQQVSRIDDIIKHQLQRAVVAGTHKLTGAIDINHCIKKLSPAFEKIYADKAVTLTLNLEPPAEFNGDNRDLMEIMGNIIDNAYKYCHHKVEIKSYYHGQSLIIEIHDDGNGVQLADRQQIFKRGLRADLNNKGQGIGLSVVNDILNSYEGSITVLDSHLGGALFRLTLPITQ